MVAGFVSGTLGGGALAGVRAPVLLTGFQTGAAALGAAGAEVAVMVLHVGAVRRLAARGRRWPARRSAAFLAGVVTVWVATGSGLAAYDDTNVTLHVVQHVLLMMVAPPLLALGRPVALVAAAAGRRGQVRLNRIMRSRAVSAATHPLPAGLLYFGCMWAMLVDRSVYGYLISHQAAHQAGHGLLLVAGLLYWTPLVAPDTSRHRLSHPGRVVLLLLSMPLEALPGVLLRFRTAPIAPINTLAGTHIAGAVLLVAATGACSLWLVAVVVQWFAFAVREDRRQERVDAAGNREWTVPAWARTGAAGPDPANGA